MCGDENPVAPTAEDAGLTRRRFLTATGSLAAATAVLQGMPWDFPARATTFAADGRRPFSMAMHLHSSFSEQSGSMDAHLFQARHAGVDVVWWTDHDWRMTGRGYRKTVHFTSLDAERGAPGEASAWKWELQRTGSLTTHSSGGIVSYPCSPRDPVDGGSMRVSAQSTNGSVATLGFWAQAHPAGWNYQCSLFGQAVSIEVLPTSIGHDAYLELRITSSRHPARGSHPAGVYVISYRFGGPGTPGSRWANGLTGVVNVPVTSGQWNSVVLRPADDIAALWPGINSRDFGFFALNLNAVSTGGVAAGNFDYLRFSRSTGEVQLQLQKDLTKIYRGIYPDVTQRQGLEISYYEPHVNWFGGTVTMPHYGAFSRAQYLNYLHYTAIPQIHAAGGLASYNHPYGATGGPLLSQAVQNQKLAQTAREMVGNRALGADIMEVGYAVRGGMDLAHHIGLWDVLSRNGVFLTGNGANDDHFAADWVGIVNNWVTSVWATSTSEPDLLRALASGRAWCSPLWRYRGSLDLLVDGHCPMGSVSVSSVAQRRLTVTATDVPAGGSLQVLQGVVDYAGGAAATPKTWLVARYAPWQLPGGKATLAVNTGFSSFVRTQVVDSAGHVVALSNPVWLLRKAPAAGIPAPRAC